MPLVKIIKRFFSSRRFYAGFLKSPVILKFFIELSCPQRSVLSPFLWNILLEKLLNRSFPFDCHNCLCGRPCLLYFPQRRLCCSSQPPINVLLSRRVGAEVHLSFNALKTVFMVFFTQKVVSPCVASRVCM